RYCAILSIPATPPTRIYTLSLHDALPIFRRLRHGRRLRARDARQDRRGGRLLQFGPREVGRGEGQRPPHRDRPPDLRGTVAGRGDRKSTRLNSSHVSISYAVFCLKKKINS